MLRRVATAVALAALLGLPRASAASLGAGADTGAAVDGEVEDVTAPEDPPAVDGADGSAATYGPEEVGGDDEKAARSRTVVVHVERPEHEERASTVVRRRDIEERLPRSAPDALRYEPGVYVQQTAHSQGSPYVRGVTGQQTIMMFDGIRLNNSTFRQGPNQYFFTIDSRTIQRLEVVRGAASTQYGSDAMGGALLATPIQPALALGTTKFYVRPKFSLRSGTADGELGGRAQLELGYGGKVGFVGGVGYRDVGQLKTAGPIRSPTTGELVRSPRFGADGQTQLGTGFKELADVINGADAATYGQRHEAALGGCLDNVENGVAVLVAGRDVEEAQLVGPRRVIGGSRLYGIAGIDQVDEVHTLHHTSILDVEAGNDAHFQHRSVIAPQVSRPLLTAFAHSPQSR